MNRKEVTVYILTPGHRGRCELATGLTHLLWNARGDDDHLYTIKCPVELAAT